MGVYFIKFRILQTLGEIMLSHRKKRNITEISFNLNIFQTVHTSIESFFL